MLDSLYEAALNKKEFINKHLIDSFEDISIDESWNSSTIEEKPLDYIISGSDGSINQINYLSFILYAISANCEIFTGNKTENIEHSDVNILLPYRHVRDRLRNYMSILEFKTALKAFNKYSIDLHLFDGSLIGSIIRPTPLDDSFSDNIDEIQKEYYPILLEDIKNYDSIKLASQSFFNSKDYIYQLNELNSIINLERLENLLAASELLKKRDVIGISKTSLSTDYFDFIIPDIAIFDRFCIDEGYSKPININISKDSKRSFPILNEYFRDLEFTIFYARLEKNKNMLKFELPYRASEDEVIELLETVKSICTEGYPYLLKKAHQKVKIRNQDMELISKMHDIFEKRGREML